MPVIHIDENQIYLQEFALQMMMHSSERYRLHLPIHYLARETNTVEMIRVSRYKNQMHLSYLVKESFLQFGILY